jgi:hypothetical protein
MSAHFTHRSSDQFSPHTAEAKSQMNYLTRPHTRSMDHPTSAFEVIMLILAILLMAGLLIFLIYSCLHSFQWFRNMVDPQARFRYNAERAERAGLWASRQGGAFVRGAAHGTERQLLCDRSAYLGGGRGYGWRNRGYGDGAEGGDGDSGYGSLGERRGSDSSVRSVRHRDDCDGDCGLTERRGSRPDKVGV